MKHSSVQPYWVTTLLGAYLCWYLVMVLAHFEATAALWFTALGMSLCIGSIHHLNYLIGTIRSSGDVTQPAEGRGGMMLRFFLVPFGVASLSSHLREQPVFLIFPLDWSIYGSTVPVLIGWAGFWLWQRHRWRNKVRTGESLRLPIPGNLALLIGYGLFYVCLVVHYFQPSLRLWLNALGLGFIVGIALNLNALMEAPAKGGWPRRMVILRFYFIPFAVSSFATLTADRSFTLIFSKRFAENGVAVLLVALWLALRFLARPKKMRWA